MENGYEILWTDNALEELEETIKYLEKEFTDREIGKLAKEIERITSLISQNPNLFSVSETKKVRKAVILKYNSMYYRIENKQIQILSFFSNRQSPEKRNLEKTSPNN